jgi:rare lipoprotein A
LNQFIKNTLLTTVIFTFSACSFHNPFVPPISDITDYEGGVEQSSPRVEPSQPIASDPMYRATMKPYTVRGKRYHPTTVQVGDTFKGIASWYGDDFHGKLTSNGEYYNMHDLTAAHKTLPINTLVRVTNQRNNQSTIVRINDRGPFVDNRIIDLSHQAALDIDMIKKGTAPVELEVLEFDDAATKYATNEPTQVAQKEEQPAQQTNKRSSVWKRYDPTEFSEDSSTTQVTQNQSIITDGEYSIQIASLSNKDKADLLKEKCYNGTDGYNAYIKEKVFNDQTIYRVLLGGFQSIQEAKDFIQKRHYKGAFIVRN